ncbi:MAG: serine/threonine protein kinase [Alloprevotella sp.]|nr:serine/threonine protein kinase [Alloprevotella sp.]
MVTSEFDKYVADLLAEGAERLAVEGATCDTYRVRIYGKWHFLKRLKPAYATDPRYRAALQKEFDTGYALDHPNLVRYISRGEDYILMEYVDGIALSEFATLHPEYFCDRHKSDSLLRQLVGVVQYLHSHGVLHLDLKPDNILVARISGEVRLVDFGFCYTDSYPETTGLTRHFCAPEQLSGTQPLDVRADIYALGKIMASLPEVSKRYRHQIRRCTQPDREDRYGSASELLAQIGRKSWGGRILLLTASLAVVLLGGFLIGRNVFTADTVVPAVATDSISVSEPEKTISAPPHEAEQPSDNVANLQEAIRRTITPQFQTAFSLYADSLYEEIDQQQLARRRIAFEEQMESMRTDFERHYAGHFPASAIDVAWHNVLEELEADLVRQMLRNQEKDRP